MRPGSLLTVWAFCPITCTGLPIGPSIGCTMPLSPMPTNALEVGVAARLAERLEVPVDDGQPQRILGHRHGGALVALLQLAVGAAAVAATWCCRRRTPGRPSCRRAAAGRRRRWCCRRRRRPGRPARAGRTGCSRRPDRCCRRRSARCPPACRCRTWCARRPGRASGRSSRRTRWGRRSRRSRRRCSRRRRWRCRRRTPRCRSSGRRRSGRPCRRRRAAQAQPGSTWHIGVQPSPAAVLPSSQASPSLITWLPQRGIGSPGAVSGGRAGGRGVGQHEARAAGPRRPLPPDPRCRRCVRSRDRRCPRPGTGAADHRLGVARNRASTASPAARPAGTRGRTTTSWPWVLRRGRRADGWGATSF